MFKIFLLILIPCLVQSAQYLVSDELSLHSTIAIVQPGDSIRLTPPDENILYFKTQFIITRNGTQTSRISLFGHPNVRFSRISTSANIELHYTHYWSFYELVFEDCESSIYIKGGQFNEFYHLSFKRINWRAFGINGGISNKFIGTNIENSRHGVEIWDGFSNIFNGGSIIDTTVGIDVDRELGSTIQNIKFLSSHADQFYDGGWFIRTNDWSQGEHLIIGNEFIREGNSSAIVELDCGISGILNNCGYLKNNTFLEVEHIENNDKKPWVRILRSNFTIEDNFFFASGIKIFSLEDNEPYSKVRGTKFFGNQMYFFEEKPENVCIFGESAQAEETEISDDNICFNGKLTNIFD